MNNINIQNRKNHKLSIYHWNCFSLNLDRITELKMFLVEKRPDIICLNELKLNEAQCNLYMNFEQYITIHKSRNSFGGGVAMLIRKSIDYTAINFDDLGLECLAIKIETAMRPLVLISYYNPKALSVEIFEKAKSLKMDFIIIGDLNARSRSLGCIKENQSGSVLENILINNDLVVLNDRKPTYFRFQSDYREILDLAVGTPWIASQVTSFEVLDEDLMGSDHAPICVTIDTSLQESRGNNSLEQNDDFDLSKADWFKFQEALNIQPSDEQWNDVEKLNTFIVNSILTAANLSIPKMTQKKSGTLPPNILLLIRERRELRRRIKHDQSLKTEYNRLTKRIKASIIEFNSDKWEKFVNEHGNNMPSSRPMWRRINKARSNKSGGNKIPTLVSNGIRCTTDEEKANLFASMLEKTFEGSNAQFDESHKLKVEKEVREYLENEVEEEIDLINIQEIKKVLKYLRTSATHGESKIHNRMLKNLPDGFLKVVARLANLTLMQGKIPNSWKLAKIIMIPKTSGSSNDPAGFRPISLTCCLCKLIEKIIQKRIYHSLEMRGILIVNQSGFRKNRGTSDNLFFLTQKIKESFVRKKNVCSLLFDIQKAFDNVWHCGLVYKMIKSEINRYLIKWVVNFLSERCFVVQVGGYTSTSKKIRFGVPQGSCLSPLLFNIFINDLPVENRRNESYSLLFADDLATFFIFKRGGHLSSIVKRYLFKLTSWLFLWRLEMNVLKCSYSIFSNSSRTKKKYDFFMNGKRIEHEPQPKFVGVYFDEILSFNRQVRETKAKCINRLNIIRIISGRSWKLNEKTLVMIYRALLGSVIDYSFFALTCLSEYNLKQFQVIQNKAMRAIFRQPFDCPTEVFCNLSGLDMIENRLLNLHQKYLALALNRGNPIICQLLGEYMEDQIRFDGLNITPLCIFNP